MRPLHKPMSWLLSAASLRFVDAAHGSDDNSGSESSPWQSINYALKQLAPGDTLLLRGGVYYEHVYIARAGRSEAPITLRSYPGEVAIIDGGWRGFCEVPQESWVPVEGSVPDYYRSAQPYRNARYALGHFADTMVGLLTYYHREDIEELVRTTYDKIDGEPFPMPVYLGPGVWHDGDSGYIYCRLSHTNYGFETPGAADYKGVRNPREVPLVIAPYGSLPLFIDGARHIALQDIVIRGAGEDAVKLRGAHDVTFDNVTVYCGTYGLHSRSSGPVKFLNSALYGSVPPWHVHAGQSLRVYSLYDKLPNGKPPTRDVARLNTHVVLAIEGRTEEQVDYATPSNHQWEIAYSDFTDSLDGIHLGGFGVRFHHNRIDRMQDDALYLTPLTPGALSDVQIYNNLFTRCLMSFGFGGLSEPAVGPVYIYRNIIDQRAEFLWSHYHRASNVMCATHFRGPAKMGELYFYHNTIVTLMCPKVSRTVTADIDRTYAQSTLINTEPGLPRRVFNNLFVYPEGMIPPSEDSLPSVTDDVQLDGNVHFDLVNPAASAAKLQSFRASELFAQSKNNYAPGWEARARVGDPRFRAFDTDQWVRNDYRIEPGRAAAEAGVALPTTWPDIVTSPGHPDAGALPVGAESFRAGRELDADDVRIYQWLEKAATTGKCLPRSEEPRLKPPSAPKRLAPPAAPGSEIEQLRKHGWCVLREVIPHEIAKQARFTLSRIGVTCGVIAQGYNGNLERIPFYTRINVIKDTQLFAPYLADVRLINIAQAALNGSPSVTSTTMLYHEPGTERGRWHVGEPCDAASTANLRRDKITHLTTVWMFSPFRADNGGILVLPDSQGSAEAPGNTVEEELTVTGKLGDVLIMDSRLWRAVAANEGDVPRLSVVVGYTAAGEREISHLRNPASVMSPGLFDSLPESAKPLFRYWPD